MSKVRVLGIDRVLIATTDLDESARTFAETLGLRFGATVNPADEPLANRVSPVGIEFVTGDDGSAVARFLDESSPGLYALSLEVADAEEARQALADRGIEPIDEMEFAGFRELFYHPKAFEGVLLALTEYDHTHPAESAADAAGLTDGTR
jgi:catechol 2,3-dioxygenase-like lactoylglutathione lyase family enzyme